VLSRELELLTIWAPRATAEMNAVVDFILIKLIGKKVERNLRR
jgi:hypothetical protein